MDLRKPITVSFNPTYLCNFRCEFCYLTPEQLADKNTIGLDRFAIMLNEIIAAGYKIEHVDIYGGEVALLSEAYLENLGALLERKDNPTINVITNLSKIHPFFLNDYVDLSVSYDFEVREKHGQVYSNIAKLPRDVSILMLASPNLMKLDVDRMIKVLNTLSNVTSVEIKPYSSNQANNLDCTDKDFEEFVKKWLQSPVSKNFAFINANRIKSSLDRTYSAYSDNHVYITPNGKYGVLEFDSNDNEFFLELDAFKEYVTWSEKEKLKVNTNPICGSCPHLGTCLTEHYRDVKDLTNSCNGFRHLLDWSQENRYLIDS